MGTRPLSAHPRVPLKNLFFLGLGLFVALAAGCNTAIEPEQTDGPPASILRNSGLWWAFEREDSFEAALPLLDAIAPRGLLLGGAVRPALTVAEDPDPSSTEVYLQTAIAEAEALASGMSVALALPALPFASSPSLCIDPADPLSDPELAYHRDSIAGLLSRYPSVTQIHTDFVTQTSPWNLPCSCAPCGEPDANGMGGRLSTLYAVFADAAQESEASPWFWAHSPSAASPDGSASLWAGIDQLSDDTNFALRLDGPRTSSSPWAPLRPELSLVPSRSRALDLDLFGSHHPGPGLPLWWPDALHDTLRQAGDLGLGEWVVQTDALDSELLGGLRSGMLDILNGLYRDLDSEVSVHIQNAVVRIFGLSAQSTEAAALSEALRYTGEAMDRASHPLGFALASDLGHLPEAFPFTYVNHSPEDPDWTARFASLESPDTSALIAVHQGLQEGAALAEAALDQYLEIEQELEPEDQEDLRASLELLVHTTAAWRAAIDADILLRAWQASPIESYAGWLRADAEALDAAAEALEAGPTRGAWPEILSLTPTILTNLASALRNQVGAGETNERPFPRITGVQSRWAGDEIEVTWTLEPAGIGWLEMGKQWPLYPDTSDIGLAPAVQWSAWIPVTDADQRLTLRACGEVEGTSICSGDHQAWTPP